MRTTYHAYVEMLAALPTTALVRETYAGATIAGVPSIRLMADERAMAASLVTHRLHMPHVLPFSTYHLHELDIPLSDISRDHPGLEDLCAGEGER